MNAPLQLVMCLLLYTGTATTSTPTEYKAAAVQFTAVGTISATAASNNRASFNAYDKITASAAHAGVQIIVFPEAVLWHWGLHHPGTQPQAPRDSIFGGYAELLPEVGSNPCTAVSAVQGNGIAQRLSCIARRHRIILVANPIDVINCTSTDPLCPPDNHFLYNTAVAFDEQGVLVAKYHKRHNGGTFPILDEPREKAELSTFVSSFGVKFGLFICYDMDFQEPAAGLYALGVRDFLFPTFWDNEPPMQTAAATQQGWSRARGVNLIAANSGDSPASAGGGLFSGGEVVSALFDPSLQNIQQTLVGSLTTPPKLAAAKTTLNTVAAFGGGSTDDTFACQVASINQNVRNRSLASGRCAWANSSRVVQAGRVSCQLDAVIHSPLRFGAQSINNNKNLRYLLWASDGALTYIGCPDAEKLQACAVLGCMSDRVSGNSTFVCSPPPRLASEIHSTDQQMPLMKRFVLRARFTPKSEVLPVVNLLSSENSSGINGGEAASALLLPSHRIDFASARNGDAMLATTGLGLSSERLAGAVLYGLRDYY